MHFLLSLLAFLIAHPFAISEATTPLVIPWNRTNSFGPDGPWSVVTIQVGSSTDASGTQPLSSVSLHPGGVWESMILRKDFCNDNNTNFADGSSECLAAEAGLYFLAHSQSVQQDITTETGLVWQWGSNAVDSVSGMAVNVLDTMTIPALNGAFTVYNSTISAVQAWQIELPDGSQYSAQVGTLSLGAPGRGVQVFNTTLSGQTVPGFEYNQSATASNSWGLHYGSASLKQEGSLVFGGYDQSRALGEMGVYNLLNSPMTVNMLDVQIGVENGSSNPFSEDSYTGLLKLNSSFNGVQPSVINPIVSYLYMSPETCAAVAENLPVTLNSQIGLYIWNTTDPRYERIISSSAYLALVFQNAGSGNLTIKVSFQLLNLTLEAPIVLQTQQYFPCKPFYANDGSGNYFLGKAFLQAAFLGMNWQLEKFFLAQAPGPGVGASNIISLGPDDTPITTDPIENFAQTWGRYWTGLPNNSDNANTTGIAREQNLTSRSGLTSGSKAGIAVGAVVGAFALVGLVLLSYLRKRRTAIPPQGAQVSQKQIIRIIEKDGRPLISEMSGMPRYEADDGHQVHELGISR